MPWLSHDPRSRLKRSWWGDRGPRQSEGLSLSMIRPARSHRLEAGLPIKQDSGPGGTGKGGGHGWSAWSFQDHGDVADGLTKSLSGSISAATIEISN